MVHCTHANRLMIGISIVACAFLSPAAPQSPKEVTPAPGAFQIRNVKHGLLLRPEDAKKADGTPLVLYPSQNWKCLSWEFESVAENTFHLLNQFTGKTFSGSKGSADSTTTAVVQVGKVANPSANPAWQFNRESDGSYRIAEKTTSNVLSASGANGESPKVVLTPWSNSEDQKWELLPAPEDPEM